jgi:hypothetical protein
MLRVKPNMGTILFDRTAIYTGPDLSAVLTDGAVKGEDVPVYATKVYRGSGGH